MCLFGNEDKLKLFSINVCLQEKLKGKAKKKIIQADISDTVLHGSKMGTVSCLLIRMFLKPIFLNKILSIRRQNKKVKLIKGRVCSLYQNHYIWLTCLGNTVHYVHFRAVVVLVFRKFFSIVMSISDWAYKGFYRRLSPLVIFTNNHIGRGSQQYCKPCAKPQGEIQPSSCLT